MAFASTGTMTSPAPAATRRSVRSPIIRRAAPVPSTSRGTAPRAASTGFRSSRSATAISASGRAPVPRWAISTRRWDRAISMCCAMSGAWRRHPARPATPTSCLSTRSSTARFRSTATAGYRLGLAGTHCSGARVSISRRMASRPARRRSTRRSSSRSPATNRRCQHCLWDKSPSYQAGGGLSLEGYWQFEYRASRISAIGSYDVPNALLAPADLARLIAVPADADADAFRFAPSQTEEPSPIGQFGLAVRWRVGDVDLGLYGERWTAKTPTIFLHIPGPGYGTPGTYDLLYPDGIETIGASAAFHLGDANLGAEISGRRGMPLVTAGVVVPSGSSDLALQPIGDTFHAQLSFLYTTPPLPLIAAGATWTGEIALNDVLSAANAPEIMPGRTRFAAAFRTVFEPQFYQVVPRLDLSVPIGIGYGLIGSSETDPTMTRRTGDISVGLTARFDQVWRAGIEFTHYLGRDQVPYLPFQPNDAIDPVAAGDFLSLSVERKF